MWSLKARLGQLFEEGHADLYSNIRNKLFPQDTKGSEMFCNRAGDKLMQLVQASDLFASFSKGIRFLDVCGGPGAFSQLLLSAKAPQPSLG